MMGRIIQPIGDRIIIPKLKRKPSRKMWMGLEDHFPPTTFNPKLSQMSILTSGGVHGPSTSPSGGDPIDVGPGAIDAAAGENSAGWTNIQKKNPANATGTITKLEIFAYTTNITGLRFAVFHQDDATHFTSKARSDQTFSATAGQKSTFNAPGDFTAFAITEGDFLGFYVATGTTEVNKTTGEGSWYKSGDQTLPEQGSLSFGLDATWEYSIYAEGTT